jgi:hypothetical protein
MSPPVLDMMSQFSIDLALSSPNSLLLTNMARKPAAVWSQLLSVEHIIWQTAGRCSLREDSTIRWAPVVEDDIEEGTVYVQPVVVVNEVQLAEPIHEETDVGTAWCRSSRRAFPD